ncbi:MAG: hypothetical protein Q9226_007251 [Calogaya cf. arnoldii]
MSSGPETTVARPVSQCVGRLPEEGEQKDMMEVGLDTACQVEVIPQSPIRRKPRASFSGFSHALPDFRTIPKRMASQRKSPVAANGMYHDHPDFKHQTLQSAHDTPSDEPSVWDKASHPHPKAPGWLRRCVSTTFRHRRRTFDSPSRPATARWAQNDPCCIPIPAVGTSPPTLPENGAGGAAARAAAAQQNEMLDCLRRYKKDRKDRKVRGDAESGVGIDTRFSEIESTMARRDPASELPKELFTHILSYLDAASLISSELVSWQWHISASDPLVWKQIFHGDFRPQTQTIPENSSDFQIGGRGLGNARPDQDWKRMWKVRKALHQRWTDSHAAAIYLEGHYDSVYCVQFDEDKILTGSRDRTIRIWDAHTYRCTRVLGVPAKSHPVPLPPLTENSGPRPFTRLLSKQFKMEVLMKSIVKPPLYHVGSILCLQYDDNIMITGSSDCTCIVWDVKAEWKPIRRVRYHKAGVLDICFDKKHVVSCSKDTTVCLWDRQSGEQIHRLSGHRGPVNAVQLRGNLAVSASGDGVAKLWNLVSGSCVKEFPSKERGMACVEFSLDSLTIFAGGNDQVIYQFDASTGELLREFRGHSDLVRSLHLDSANGRVVSGSYDTSVRAYDVRTGNNIVELTGWTTSWILSAKLDYRRIIATSQDGRAVVIDFGYRLPGMELLEQHFRPGMTSLNDDLAHLKVDN